MADMKRKPAFGTAATLAPIIPTAEDEAALTKAAKAVNFEDRAAGGSTAADLAVVEEPSAEKKPETKAKPKKAPAKKKASARKPATAKKAPTRKPATSQEFPELVEDYLALIKAGEDLPNPPNPMWQKVDRHRVYSMFPVHTAAALQAYSDAKGYRQLWMGIDDLLREAGMYEADE